MKAKAMEERTFLFYSLYTRDFIPQACPSLENLKKEYNRYLLTLTGNDVRKTAEILEVPPDSLEDNLQE